MAVAGDPLGNGRFILKLFPEAYPLRGGHQGSEWFQRAGGQLLILQKIPGLNFFAWKQGDRFGGQPDDLTPLLRGDSQGKGGMARLEEEWEKNQHQLLIIGQTASFFS